MAHEARLPADPDEVTGLLAAVRRGDEDARQQLFAVLYDELRAVARRQLRRWRPGQTLTTTALVHESYLKLVQPRSADWQDRCHFLSVAALAMRQVLVDSARRRASKKRGGDEIRIAIEALGADHEPPGAESAAAEVLAIDQALTSLATVDGRLSRLVELRFFGGLTEVETARVMGTSERTVRRDWRKARAFLLRALDAQAAG